MSASDSKHHMQFINNNLTKCDSKKMFKPATIGNCSVRFAIFLRLFLPKLAVEIMCFRHIPMVIGVNLAVYEGIVGSCTRHAKYHKEKFVVSSHTYIYLILFTIYFNRLG